MRRTDIHKPDILLVLQSEGLNLKQKGHSYWAECPFHQEKTASLKVSPERQSFYCFGCHAHGDVIEYIQKTKGLTFPAALEYLGIDEEKLYRPDPEQAQKNALFGAFEYWCRAYNVRLCDMSRRLNLIKPTLKTEAQVEAYAWLYHEESIWELHMDILTGRDERAKLDLYKEVRYAA